ncbi:hypothetical protein ACFE04_024043 [Oxalis oulophora]
MTNAKCGSMLLIDVISHCDRSHESGGPVASSPLMERRGSLRFCGCSTRCLRVVSPSSLNFVVVSSDDDANTSSPTASPLPKTGSSAQPSNHLPGSSVERVQGNGGPSWPLSGLVKTLFCSYTNDLFSADNIDLGTESMTRPDDDRIHADIGSYLRKLNRAMPLKLAVKQPLEMPGQ